MDQIDRIIKLTQELFEKNDVDESHNIDHALAVKNHIELAIESDLAEGIIIPVDERLALKLGAIVHDTDDHKYFNTENYQNARSILKSIKINDKIIVNIIDKVKIVSFSQNGNHIENLKNRWDDYIKAADQLEALGIGGIKRCKQFAEKIGNPLFLESTPRATTLEELYQIASYDRYHNYVNKRLKSVSMIDHFYDKLLHLKYYGQNKYFIEEYFRRHKIIELFLLEFGKTGQIPDIV